MPGGAVQLQRDVLQRPVHVQERARTGPLYLHLPDGLHGSQLQQHLDGPLRRQSLLQRRPVRPAKTGPFQVRLPGRIGRSTLRRQHRRLRRLY